MEWDLFENTREATPPVRRKSKGSTYGPVPTRTAVPAGHILINGKLQPIFDDRPSRKTLDQLPPEVIEHVFKFLKTRDVVNVAATCKYLRDTSLSECIWTEKIEQEFGLKPEIYRKSNLSARKFYIGVLYKYGWALGCWVRQVKHYGGILKVVVDDGMIVGKEVVPPENPNFDQEVRI